MSASNSDHLRKKALLSAEYDGLPDVKSPPSPCTEPPPISEENSYKMMFNIEAQSNSHTPLLTATNSTENEDAILALDVNDETRTESVIETCIPINGASQRDTSNTNSNSNSDIQSISTPTPSEYDVLMRYREQYNAIDIIPKEGLQFFYVDKDWLELFLDHDFDPQDTEIFEKLGNIKTVLQDAQVASNDASFVSYDQMSQLIKWFQLEEDHCYLVREMVWCPLTQRLILDINPLLITPHIFVSNALHVNRYKFNNKDSEIMIPSFKQLPDLLQSFSSYYECPDLDFKKSRLWVVDFDTNNVPSVIIPSSLKHVKSKYLLKFKKKTKTVRLGQLNINRCHIMLELKQNDSYFLDLEDIVLPGTGVVGLSNLGNTCYMNSALQCLAHIPELNAYFLYRFYEKELNKDNPLGNGGKVALAFGNLISSLFDVKFSGNSTSYSAREFKYTIGHFNSLFADYRQQDSQEFIAYLLDGLHEDLNRVLKKPYVEKPELEKGKENDTSEIKHLAQKCWDAHKLRNDSAIVDLFVALYKSTLLCPICNHISVTFDPYNDLTLPLPITKKWSHKVKILPSEGYPTIIEVELPKTGSYMDLKAKLSILLDISETELLGVEVHKNNIYRNFEDSSSDSRYLPISELIVQGDDIWFYQIKKENPDDLIIPVFSTCSTTQNDGINRNIWNFGLPFFITLSVSDRKNFGIIERKLFENYQQLSTYSGFSTFSNNSYTFDLNDFKNVELFLKYFGASDTDINSKVTSNPVIRQFRPDFTSNTLFSIKKIDATMDRTYRNRYNYENSIKNTLSNSNTYEGPSFWVPENENTITNKDAILLENQLSMTEKAFYYYSPRNLELLENEEMKKGEEENENENGKNKESKEIDEMSLSPASLGDQNKVHCSEEEHIESGAYMSDEKHVVSMGEIPQQNHNDVSDLCKQMVKNSSEVEGSSGSPEEPTLMTTSFTLPPQETESHISFAKESEYNSTSSQDRYFVNPLDAIVCDFSEASFNTCFKDIEDENDLSGVETWLHPSALVNKELEEERKNAKENAKNSVDIYDCLNLFTQPEILGQNDLWYCPSCKEHRQATKKIELWSAPDILTIHLKRFESTRSFSDKIDMCVDFPIEGLDLRKFVSDKDGEHIYDLFAVDNHFGGLGGGHYTAYVKNFIDNKWYYYDDSRVTPIDDPRESIKGSAYLLFYRKRTGKSLGGEFFDKMTAEIARKQRDLAEKSRDNGDDSTDEDMEGDIELVKKTPGEADNRVDTDDCSLDGNVADSELADEERSKSVNTRSSEIDDVFKRRKLENSSISSEAEYVDV